MLARSKMSRRTWLSALAVVALTPVLFLSGCGGDEDNGVNTDFVFDTPLVGANGNLGTAHVVVSRDRSQIDVSLNTDSSIGPVSSITLNIASTPGGSGPTAFNLFNSASGDYAGALGRILTSSDFTSSAGVTSFQDAVNQIINGFGYILVNANVQLRGNLNHHNQGSGS